MPKLPPWPSRYSRAAEIKRLREELLAAELARLDALEEAGANDRHEVHND